MRAVCCAGWLPAVALLVSCAAVRTSSDVSSVERSHRHSADSSLTLLAGRYSKGGAASLRTVGRVVHTRTLAPLRGGCASMEIPLRGIDSLPAGAVFRRRSGRTEVALRREGDRLVVTAVSDSLPREVSEECLWTGDTAAAQWAWNGSREALSLRRVAADSLHGSSTMSESRRTRRRPLLSVVGALSLLLVLLWGVVRIGGIKKGR